jgi:lipopolysaccharide biosynthesis protein
MYVAAAGVARIFLSGGNGAITATGNITAYASDRRLKTNIKTITNALDKLMKINGVEFDWVKNIVDIGFQPQSMHETGVIAQEIQKVLPQLVHEANDDMKTLSVAYGNIVGVLIEAVKELTEKVNKLEGK